MCHTLLFAHKITKKPSISHHKLSNQPLFYAKLVNSISILTDFHYFCKTKHYIRQNMKQEYARVSVEMPENKDKKSLSQELTYEIENNDINDEFTVKF